MPNSQSRTEQRLFIALLALLFWIPIPLGSNRPWAWALLEVWSFVLFSIWFVQNTYAPRWQTLRPYFPLLLLFGLFVIWAGLQQLSLPIKWLQAIAPQTAMHILNVNPETTTSSLSLDPSQSHISFVKGLCYWCVLFLVLALVNTPQRLKTLIMVVLLSGTFQACYGVLLALSGSETTWMMNFQNENSASGSFRSRSQFANFLVLCLCLGIGLLIASLTGSKNRSLKEILKDTIIMLLNGKAVVRLCLAMMVIGLVMSHSRMGNTAFFASLSITGVLGLLLIRQKSRSLTILLTSLLVIDLMIVGSWFGIDKVKNRLQNTSLAHETRDDVNQFGLSIIEQYPLTGTGGGSFYSTFPSVKGPGIYGFYDQGHNDYLQFSMEFGLPAILLLGVAVLWSLYHAFWALNNRRNSLLQGLAFAAVMAIIAELLMLSTDFHLQIPATAIYFMMCLALAWKARFMEIGKPHHSH